MSNNITFGLLLAGVLITAGCSTSSAPSKATLAKDEVKALEVREDAAKLQREKEQEKMEAEIKAIPSWALEAPRPDATGIYAVGMAESDVLRISLRKAELEAEYGLAKNYSQELSGSERSYTQDNAGHLSSEQYTALIDKLVSQVSITGFEVVHQEVRPINGKYNSFVLLKLPFEKFNQVLQEQRSKEKPNDKAIAEAFDDLTRRLEKRRQQKLDEQKSSTQQVTEQIPQLATK